jgi:hypothetical protein
MVKPNVRGSNKKPEGIPSPKGAFCPERFTMVRRSTHSEVNQAPRNVYLIAFEGRCPRGGNLIGAPAIRKTKAWQALINGVKSTAEF